MVATGRCTAQAAFLPANYKNIVTIPTLRAKPHDVPGHFKLDAGPEVITEPLDAQGQPYEGYEALEEPVLGLPHEGYLLPLTGAALEALDGDDALAFTSEAWDIEVRGDTQGEEPEGGEPLMPSSPPPRVTQPESGNLPNQGPQGPDTDPSNVTRRASAYSGMMRMLRTAQAEGAIQPREPVRGPLPDEFHF